MILSASDARRLGAPFNIEFVPAELRELAFDLERQIDGESEAITMKRPAARLARRALFALVDRIERDD